MRLRQAQPAEANVARLARPESARTRNAAGAKLILGDFDYRADEGDHGEERAHDGVHPPMKGPKRMPVDDRSVPTRTLPNR
jgi:hypothetical protein